MVRAGALAAWPGPRLASASVEVQARRRVDDVADDQADRQGEGGHREEVAEREPADLADPGGAGDRADAEHDRAEDDRLDHHLDQRHERRSPSGLSLTAKSGNDQPDGDAEDHRDDDGDVEVVGAVRVAGRVPGAGVLMVPPGIGPGAVPGSGHRGGRCDGRHRCVR